MRRAMTGTLWVIPLLSALTAGCTPSEPTSVGWLPNPELDLMYRAAQSGGKPAVSKAPQEGEWAASAHRPWKYIIIHHSATDSGSAGSFDKMHRAKGWDELGYHFVIDNGNGGPDGRVEVGSRWRTQKWGAHTGGTPDNEYNNYGIGICLVGDFTSHLPTDAQITSLRRLVNYLMQTYDVPPGRVIGHRDAPAAKTDCPGRALYSYMNTNLRGEFARAVVVGR